MACVRAHFGAEVAVLFALGYPERPDRGTALRLSGNSLTSGGHIGVGGSRPGAVSTPVLPCHSIFDEPSLRSGSEFVAKEG